MFYITQLKLFFNNLFSAHQFFMPKHTQNKLSQFIKTFQKNSEVANEDLIQREVKRQKVMEYLPSDQYLISFNDSLGLYKIVLEQDKFTEFRQKKNWHKEEVKVLVFMVIDYFFKNKLDISKILKRNWDQFSFFFTGRSPDDCKFKWLSFSKHVINISPFDVEQDNLLRQILKQLDYDNLRPRWKIIAIQFNNRSHKNDYIYRSSKELKKRWVSTICPIQKGLWKKQEDLFLFQNVFVHGKRWSFISKLMKQVRTQNGVKNRYFSVIEKQTQFCMKKKILISQNEIVTRVINKIKKNLQSEQDVNSIEQSMNESKQKKNIKSSGQNLNQQIKEKQMKKISENNTQTSIPLENSAFHYYVHPISYPVFNPVYFNPYIPTIPMFINCGIVCQANSTLIETEQKKGQGKMKEDPRD